MKCYRILEWDTDFFGFRVAQFTLSNLEIERLEAILFDMRHDGVKLAYWPSDSHCLTDIEAKDIGGYFVDKKTTFVIDLDEIMIDDFNETAVVEPYNSTMSVDIEDLAVQSGEYSRFVVDPNITKDKFIDLYTIWFNRSLRKEIADEVLVIREYMNIVGMITLGVKNGRGNIGLMVVDRSYRGRGYAEALLRASHRYFINRGYMYGQVVTQGKNIFACNLYKKCGYSIETVKYFYHFWL